MGVNNSSLTRVEPVFSALMDGDPTGRSWLPRLLQLGSRSAGRIIDDGPLITKHPRWWGKGERAIPPSRELLRWLVQNLQPPLNGEWGGERTRQKRELLVARDPTTIAEALRLLERGQPARVWYVLEGESYPDACLETNRFVLVIEGKRTERHTTMNTTWMPCRSQMLRHMDAAWSIRAGKLVLGLMIVEGPGGADAVEPSPYWHEVPKAEVLESALAASLPHRTPSVRAEIADSFLGITTWQAVCATFRLPWPPDLLVRASTT